MRKVQSTLFALLAASGTACADTTLNLTQGVSPISHDVYELHMIVFWICVVIGIVVFGAMFYAMIFHRKSRGAKAAEFHSHHWLEISWTIVPVLILIAMAVPATKVLFNMNNNEKEEVTIKITGYQWKWHYEYVEDEVKFFSNLSRESLGTKAPKTDKYLREVDNPLVLPIHKKVRFLITSNDVNHAWWVPDFAVKRDAIAGFINEAWTRIDKPGTYYGQCAELCGIDHAYMPIVVIATTEQGYKDWIAKQKGQATQGEGEANRAWAMEELMTKGQQIYTRVCAACHQADGAGLPPTFPALKGSKIATGPVDGHVDIVFNGKSGTPMQAFKDQLSDVELAAVVTYERNAFGNSTGTSVQPIQVKALRAGKTMADALATQPDANAAAASATTSATATSTTATNATAESTTAESTTAESTTANAAAPASSPPAVSAAAAPATTAAAPTTVPTQAPANAMPTSSPTVTTPPPPATSTATPNAPTPTPATAPASTVTPLPSSAIAAAPTTAPAATSSSTTADLQAAMQRGEKVYMATCAVCHQPTGVGLPPTFPALRASPIAIGPLAAHIDRVLNGKPGTTMQAFKDQLNDQDLADVITYERNAWGNNTGTIVTPDQIKAARQAASNATPSQTTGQTN